MKIKNALLFFLVATPLQFYAMSIQFIAPSAKFPTTRLARESLTSFEFLVGRSKITESYNCNHQQTYTFSFHGPEDLVKRAINPTLPCNDTQTVGRAFVDGTLNNREYSFHFDKNFANNIFISLETSFVRMKASDIKMLPINSKCRLLSESQIQENSELFDYLQTLEATVLPSCPVEHTWIGPSAFTIGYAKNYQNFDRIDFVDLSIQAGLLIPFFTIDSNETESFTIPVYKHDNFGLPIQASFTAGFYDWLNIGATAIVTPFITSTTTRALNPSLTNNFLLGNNRVLTQVDHDSFVYLNFYLQAEEFVPRLTLLAGLSYAKQHKTTYTPCDKTNYPADLVNQSSLRQPWETLHFTFESEVDLASEDRKSYPRLKFIYMQPVYGTSIYRSSLLAGQLGVEIFGSF